MKLSEAIARTYPQRVALSNGATVLMPSTVRLGDIYRTQFDGSRRVVELLGEMTVTPTIAEKREAARFADKLPACHALRSDVVAFALLSEGEEISAGVYDKVIKAARAFAAL